jgi:chromate transporter
MACTIVALQGFGGVLVIIQRELVDKRRWLTRAQFVEDWAVAQVLPGPNVVNLVIMLGDRYFGWRGALAALAGMLLIPLLLVLGMAAVYNSFAHLPMMQGALRGMGAAAAGLIGAAAIKMMAGLKGNALGTLANVALIALTFIAVGLLRIPLIWVVLGLGIPSCGYAYRRIQAVQQPGPGQ